MRHRCRRSSVRLSTLRTTERVHHSTDRQLIRLITLCEHNPHTRHSITQRIRWPHTVPHHGEKVTRREQDLVPTTGMGVKVCLPDSGKSGSSVTFCSHLGLNDRSIITHRITTDFPRAVPIRGTSGACPNTPDPIWSSPKSRGIVRRSEDAEPVQFRLHGSLMRLARGTMTESYAPPQRVRNRVVSSL